MSDNNKNTNNTNPPKENPAKGVDAPALPIQSQRSKDPNGESKN